MSIYIYSIIYLFRMQASQYLFVMMSPLSARNIHTYIYIYIYRYCTSHDATDGDVSSTHALSQLQFAAPNWLPFVTTSSMSRDAPMGKKPARFALASEIGTYERSSNEGFIFRYVFFARAQ